MKKNYDVDFNTYFRIIPTRRAITADMAGFASGIIQLSRRLRKPTRPSAIPAQFINELRRIRKEFRTSTPVYHCERLSRMLGTRRSISRRRPEPHRRA